MPDDPRLNRRNFFRHGLGELLRPLVQSGGALDEVIRQINSLDSEAATAKQNKPPSGPAPNLRAVPGIWLRPPGALPDQKFLDTCTRGGECVKVCPVQCIKIDPNGAKGNGAPYIEIDEAACVLCTGLLCMHACPSGALTPIPIQDIDMGTAAWHEPSCLRTNGEECTICIDHCPIGEVAIQLQAGKVQVIESGCTGCGVCQHDCPTTPKSITITPRSAAGPVSRGRR
jgi:ferredoxin-type protein NapG